MYGLALAIERLVLRPLVSQPDIILFMATFGVTYFLIGFGELLFGGNPKSMITKELLLPDGALDLHILGGKVQLQKLDIAAAAIALDHGLKPRVVLPEDTDRARLAGGRRRSSGGAIGRDFARSDLGHRLVHRRRRRARDRNILGRAVGRVVCAASRGAEGVAGV